jgi:hypothetical protein
MMHRNKFITEQGSQYIKQGVNKATPIWFVDLWIFEHAKNERDKRVFLINVSPWKPF